MTDIFDQAQQQELENREAALAAVRQASALALGGPTHCACCGKPIPEKRRQAVKTSLCIDCARAAERKGR